jgi:hypothetical protein
MKNIFFALSLVLLAGTAFATPSTTYWTPCVMDIQPYKVWHFGEDNYFTVNKKADSGEQGAFPTDVQLEVGVLPFEKIQMEVGIDAMYPTDHPYMFNAKIGTPEDSLFKGSPGINVGIFDVGTYSQGQANHGRTDYDIVDFIVGKTLPLNLGRLHAGYYVGNAKALRSSTDEKENTGYMVAFDHGFFSTKDKAGSEYSQVVFAADYASGKNYIGGGGLGLYYYFTKDISMLVGPVWFNDKGINGAMKWTTQLDINF